MKLKSENLRRGISFFLIFNILYPVIFPTTVFALTGGPSQAEYESFEPAGATEMVNLFTGDFTYNIPLLDVDGYPLNISYHAGISPEQEASWVGLGWNLNPGAIMRGMRGLPDDFDGDVIQNDINIKSNKIYGINTGGGVELSGISAGMEAGFGIVYNNYKGLGIELNFGLSGSLSASYFAAGAGINGGTNLRISSQDGVDFSASVGLGANIGTFAQGNSWSAKVNSRNGLTENKVGGSRQVGFLHFGQNQQTEINLVPNTAYTPNLQFSMQFSGFSGDFHTGGEFYWTNGHSYNRGFMYEQGLKYNSNYIKGYGFLNLEHADITSLLDFNRDQDGTYYLECPKLPAASLTYDLYNVNAQGLGMLFRPHRNDVGGVFDNIVVSNGTTNALSVEANYGNYGELGINTHDVQSFSVSGAWTSGNMMLTNGYIGFRENNKFSSSQSGNTFEPSYFKNMLEYNFSDEDFDATVGNDKISTFQLLGVGGNCSFLKNNLLNGGIASSIPGNQLKKSGRQSRNDNMSYLTRKEAQLYGFQKEITYYDVNDFTPHTMSRDFGTIAKESHLSEVTVLKSDGARYIFGLPVYNTKMEEVVFNAASNTKNCTTGIVSYSAGVDNSVDNEKGNDHFYSSKSIPPFAHSFLLTNLLSPDYVDRTDDGPTSDDFGNYTKFNYSKTENDYQWRVPVTGTANEAILNRGLEADPTDDKGMYVYGEKQIWYVNSIETKNYIAAFYLSDRNDAKPVVDKNGAISTTNPLQKLDKIVLYNKHDIQKNGANAIPIKTVHFEYDYSLCPGTPNAASGKLTLKKIYFTYGKSEKGRFNPFKFSYCDSNHDGTISSEENPVYSRTNIDRWGNYKTGSNNCDWSGTALGNDEFPYADQDRNQANKNSSVWALSSIETPAGSIIKVFYESDDYAYVQDKLAGQMVTLVDVVNSTSSTNPAFPTSYTVPSSPNVSGNLYENILGVFDPREYLVVDLKNLKISNENGFSSANDLFKHKCLPQNGAKMYFKGLVSLGSSNHQQCEFIPGYAQIDINNSSLINDVTSDGFYKNAYIKINPVAVNDEAEYSGIANPISKAAWQMTRLMLPKIAYPGSEPGTNSFGALVGLLGALTEVLSFHEKNERLLKKGYSRYINCAKSWVRLNNVTEKKLGGGHRVSKIQIEDSWNSMASSEETSIYGQTYDYTIENDANSSIISSGVASYEPQIGGDEISLRSPMEYSVKHIFAPNDAHFVENPIGEAFFPPPVVGYRQITVRNIDHEITTGSGTVNVGNIGKTIYSFYTAKDFPIKSELNGVDMNHYKPNPTEDIFSALIEDHVYLAQGFLIKLNDMHGKIKSVLTYQEGQNIPISGMKYFYKTKNNSNELDNEVPLISPNNEIKLGIMGRMIDMTADFRMTVTSTMSNYSNFNLNVSAPLPWPYPIPVPSYFYGMSIDNRSFQSATLTKIVNQQGIVERVETINNYSKNTTENLVWDKLTGDVVVSKTTNNFKDPVYSFNYPAYWIYERMGGAYKNIGVSFIDAFNTSDGKILITNGLIQPGDELALSYLNSSYSQIFQGTPSMQKYWAVKTGNDIYLTDKNGVVVDASHAALNTASLQPSATSHYALKIIRSGYRNLTDADAGSITSLSNFVGSYTGTPLVAPLVLNSKILNATAIEYSDNWDRFCTNNLACFSEEGEDENPYINGLAGTWRPKRTYNYLTQRLSDISGESNIRYDGTYESFKPYYTYLAGIHNKWVPIYSNLRADYVSNTPFDKWILNSQITKVSPFGNVSEVKDAINRYSSSLYGYNNTVKTADVINSKYRHSGFDGVEDYGYITNLCENRHFIVTDFNPENISTQAHTGRYSLKAIYHSGGINRLKYEYNTNILDCTDHYGSNNNTDLVENEDPYDPEQGPERSPYAPPCGCLSNFSPDSGTDFDQKYVLSFWAKESVPNSTGTYSNNNGTYANPGAILKVDGSVLAPTGTVKKSQIINGWQKFEYVYTIPLNVGLVSFVIELKGPSSSAIDILYDDIRVHPYNASMKSYVYDPFSLRLWAELDERNFATFYEYNEDGVLTRVKKETEKGIITIKETQKSLKKRE